MSLQIPIPGEVVPNILEIPMPGSNNGGNTSDKVLPKLSDIPVPFETHSQTPVMLADKYEEELDGSWRTAQQKAENVSVYSGHTTETITAINKFEDTNINVSIPTHFWISFTFFVAYAISSIFSPKFYGLFTLHQNIQSLRKNFIEFIIKLTIQPGCIVLTETHTNEESPAYQLSNYNPISTTIY